MRATSISTLTLCAVLLALIVPAQAQQAPRVAGPPVWLTGDDTSFLMQPVWSPDGSRLAVTGAKYAGLWVLARETGELRQITDAHAAGYGVSWAPTGTALLARVARYEDRRRQNAVAVFDLASGEQRRLTEFRASMPHLPQWAASGNVYLQRNDDLEVFDAALDGLSDSAEVTGASLFFAKEEGIATVRLQDADLQISGQTRTISASQIDVMHPLEGKQLLNVTPSPDASMVAFEVLGGDLYVMQADGTGLTRLGRGYRPSWSPDGDWVVFQRTEDDGHRFTSADLYAAHISGGEMVRLTTSERLEMNPAWSPDGDVIAFDAGGRIGLLPIQQ